MSEHHPHQIEKASTTEGLPVSPAMGPALESAMVPQQAAIVDRRVLFIILLSVILAVAAAFIAQGLMALIGLITNLSYLGRFSFAMVPPDPTKLGVLSIGVPVVGGLVVGIMARYGSKAIRGHGIPEAMEQVLLNQSRIPARVTLLKPLSSAVSIGTGGPFGAEGPIIATGGALGSLIGQFISTSAAERKTLLAAGAAAGMAATFGSPVSAVLLAVELLLFEFRARSIIPVALASATAAAIRMIFDGAHPVFAMPNLMQPSGSAQVAYIVLGAIIGVAAVLVTRAVYVIEDSFEHLPVHWMWWPAIGAVAVGVIGYFVPKTLGVGYGNITDVISNNLALQTVAILCVCKFISWAIALGSGTSGGTLAPLFTIGGSLGALLGAGAATLFPQAGIDPRIAALVGMAAMFAGASRALLASVIFAFETTLQPLGLLPLLGGCTAAYLVSCLLMRNTIMTEKIVRRGVRVPAEYSADFLDQVLVRDVAAKNLVTLRASDTVQQARQFITSGIAGSTHQGFPLLNEHGHLIGLLTRRDILDPAIGDAILLKEIIKRPPVVVFSDCTLRAAADHMVNHNIGRLVVIDRAVPTKLVGIITRSDLLGAHRKRLQEHERAEPNVRIPSLRRA